MDGTGTTTSSLPETAAAIPANTRNYLEPRTRLQPNTGMPADTNQLIRIKTVLPGLIYSPNMNKLLLLPQYEKTPTHTTTTKNRIKNTQPVFLTVISGLEGTHTCMNIPLTPGT